MLAKCSRCTQTFQTDRYGEQFCPFCGASVMIAAPDGTGAPGGFPPGPTGDPSAPQDQPAPLDAPALHGGWLSAFFATWKQSVLDPGTFFTKLKPGPELGGALPFALVCLIVGGLFAGAYQMLQAMLQAKQLADMQHQLANLPPELQRTFGHLLGLFGKLGPLLPVFTLVAFFVNAACIHLALKIVRGNKVGFRGTLRTLAFCQGPYLFAVIPVCGSSVAGIWVLVLSVIGLSKVHRISVGRTLGAYALLMGFWCCCCIPSLGGIMGASMAQSVSAAASQTQMDLPPMPDMPDAPDSP